MNKLAKIALSALLASSGLLAIGQSANAMPSDVPALDGQNNISCSYHIIPAVPGQPAVVEKELVTPAETAVFVKFVHVNADKNHQEPRWELEGWNAQNNADSEGWTEAVPRETEVRIIKEAVYKDVIVTPAVPAQEEKTVEECITQPSVPPVKPETPAITPEAPADTRNCAQIGRTNILEGDKDYRPELDRDSDGVGCEVGVADEPVATAPQATSTAPVPVGSVTSSAPLANTSSVTEKPTELAYTGSEEETNWTLGILGVSALVGGTLLIGLRRKLS